jgi:hypothetical protein
MFKRYLSRYILSSPDGLLWYPDGDGSTAAATPPPASATPPPAATPPPSNTPPPAAAAGTPPPSKFSYDEDRSNWVKPDVHKKAEGLINRTSAELAKLKADIAERDRRIAALAGITPPPSAEETEAEKVAAAFYSLPQFAHLKGITPELLKSIEQLVHQGSTLTEARDHLYNQQADRFLDSMDQAFADELGAQTLTPGQQRKLRAAFGAWVPDKQADPEGHAAFTKRYNSGDPSLISEFVKEYAADMLEPARRQATVPIAQRRAVPRSGPAAAVVTQKQKPDYSKMSVTEMLESAEKDAEAIGR